MKKLFFIFSILLSVHSQAQMPDHIYKPSIHSATLTKYGDPLGYPIMNLNSSDRFDLNFDDLDGNVRSYYFTYQLCNADWTPSSLFSFDYITGFQNIRISTFRNSSIAFTRYTHYQATVPDRNCMPSRSGNYLLKVFLDGDTSKLVFTKRFLVVDSKAMIAAQVQQPFNGQWFRTHQKLQIAVTLNPTISAFNQEDVKTVIVQNFAWSIARFPGRPNIYRGNYFEYSDEAQTTFPAGKEWRWLDLQTLQLMTDRVQKIDKQSRSTDVYVRPDGAAQQRPYVYYRDNDGLYFIGSSENVNPFWQTDYARVHFTFFPPGNRAYEGKSVYLFGELTNYEQDDSSRMIFNAETGAYEKTLFLKQGYYNYSYIGVPDKRDSEAPLYENLEGDYWGTENAYMVLVYYRAYGSRADELIGVSMVNSLAR